MERYSYYWYHFGLDELTIEEIEDAIANKDYDMFMKFKKKFPENLPDDILKIGKGMATVDINDKANFMKITYDEHENG